MLIAIFMMFLIINLAIILVWLLQQSEGTTEETLVQRYQSIINVLKTAFTRIS